jgi:hypothetical protein
MYIPDHGTKKHRIRICNTAFKKSNHLEPTLKRATGGKEAGTAGVEAVSVDGGRVLVLPRIIKWVISLLHNKFTVKKKT